MPPSGHSAKETLPSVSDLALGKEYFKILKKSLLSGTRQSQEINYPTVLLSPFSSLTLSSFSSFSARRRACCPPPRRLPAAAPSPAVALSAPPHVGTPRPPTQAPARLLAAAATRRAGPPPHGRARHARRTRLAAPSRAVSSPHRREHRR